MGQKIDLVGHKYNRLRVLEEALPVDERRKWKCACDCGATVVVDGASLRYGSTKSCGCLKREKTIQRNKQTATRDGLTHSPVGSSWTSMMTRCFNPNNKDRHNYSEIGIRPCEFIKASPINIIFAIGDKPPGLTLDRIDSTKGYFCGSCEECLREGNPLNIRWATRAQQMRNQRRNFIIEIDGVSQCAMDWSRSSGIGESVIRYRYRNGIRGSALLAPIPDRRALVEIDGVIRRKCEWARIAGISQITLSSRIESGITGSALLEPVDMRYSRRRKR